MLVLQEMYHSVKDIDLTTGLWSESIKEGTSVPHTFHCLVTKMLKRTVVSDRHWYERSNRPNAFTAGNTYYKQSNYINKHVHPISIF